MNKLFTANLLPLLKVNLTTIKSLPTLYHQFSTQTKPLHLIQKQLSQSVTQQINSQQDKTYDLQQSEKLLKMIDWQIKKNNSKLQLFKQTLTHKFHAFITIKPPIQMNPQHKMNLVEQKQMEIQVLQDQLKKRRNPAMRKHLQELKRFLSLNPFDQPMYQITIFVQKINSKSKSKYLCLQYLSNSKHVQIDKMSVFSKIIPNRVDRIQDCKEFEGRPLGKINPEIVELLYLNTQLEFQLRREVLQTMFQLTCCHEQLEYLQWLKQLNELL